MANVADIINTVHRYIELVGQGRVEDIVKLFADDATVEDPVGSGLHIGREAIRRFYAAIGGADGAGVLVTLRVAGREAAFHVEWTFPERRVRIDPIDVMTFADDGRISSLKAYWATDTVTSLPASK